MSKKNIQYVVLSLILLATLVVIYFYFIKPSSNTSTQAIFSQIGIGGASPASISSAPTDLDIKTLKDPRLQSLISPNYPVVDSSEVGKPDPFK